MDKPKCAGCFRTISGRVSIDTRRRKLGKKLIEQVDYYCQDCHKKLKIERALNVYRKEKTKCKKKNNRKKRK